MPLAPAKKKSFQSVKWPESCPQLVLKLNDFFTKAVDGPFTFDQLRTLDPLYSLIDQLKTCNEPFLIFSLLWCKLDFAAKAGDDETSVDCARGYACEIAAMRLLRTYDSQQVLIALTHDYKASEDPEDTLDVTLDFSDASSAHSGPDDQTPLLRVDTNNAGRRRKKSRSASPDLERPRRQKVGSDSFTALEVAIVAQAKHFISAHICQDILAGIWRGEIIFWNDISAYETKRATFYDKDIDSRFWNFARLRVPQYAFVIESFNFLMLAALYLMVVIYREYRDLGSIEAILALWFLGFTYQEYDQFREAGTVTFYLANPFNYFDLGIIVVAFSWIVLRVIGIAEQNPEIVARSYDILSLQGVLLVPRLFSFLSLSPYFGTLFPCMRRLAADFLKFLVLIVAMYLGFLVTFSILGRNRYSISEVSWLLVRVFYGGSGVGFEAMHSLHAVLGAPLMFIFVTFTQIVLTTAMISILSNSVRLVMDNARSEYHFMFATTCLEATKSDHLISLTPPFNLLGLILVRPLRLFLPSNHIILRKIKLRILEISHAPYVLLISLYERSALRPVTSEAHRRRLEKAKHYAPISLLRPHGGMPRLGSGLLGPAGVLGVLGHPRARSDDVENDGIDLGDMLSDTAGAIDADTKERIERMENQIEEMKSMMGFLVAQAKK